MARLLVATDLSSLAQRSLGHRLAERARADGHEADVVNDVPLAACKDADAVIALLDGAAPAALPLAVAATAHALGMPTLALHTHALPDTLASLFTQAQAVTREEDLANALPAFYASIRPFAGKLVRDQVPRLVREAGHQVQFREAAPDERARYLKRKVADEAAELLAADPGQEREEVADLLEALETLLRVRGYDRDDLRLVKEAKRKRRGGFERFLIVESASAVTASTPSVNAMAAWPSTTPTLAATPFTPAPAQAMPEQDLEEEEQLEMDLGEEDHGGVEEEEPAFAMPAIETPAADEAEVALPSWMGEQPLSESVPQPRFEAPRPTPSYAASTPSYAATQAPTPPATPAPVQVPSWLSSTPIPASNPTARTTYEQPPPPFQPPAIPSFRPEKVAPVPAGRRTNLWNLGAKGEPQEIPEVFEDPDRVEPHIREI